MKGKASKILEELGKEYLDYLINNYNSKPILSNKNKNSEKDKEEEKSNKLKTLNKKKFS
jgi:hypothetical protein